MKVAGVILSAGSSTRFGQEIEKQYLSLMSKPIIIYSVEVFEALAEISDYVVVAKEEKFNYLKKDILAKYNLTKFRGLVPGGHLRANSVMNALNFLKKFNPDYVLIHDAARPLITSEFVKKILTETINHSACVPGLRVTDTVKITDVENYIEDTLNRNSLYAVQTPQGFKFDLLLRAYLRGMTEGFEGTDDASYIERINEKVKIIDGLYSNIKITYPKDIEIAKILMKEKE
ncbi:2-C-methyl-D-erythritol 4-phosphate cytidylyltransferase [Candidatus Dependentiae bacterium]|nr:2-C-methyl-D-erythritol 4-phosphate cytidylyltransferase [Candidatus Dependentiae bacterium]